ncbi:hypothetical protein VaNZ11_006457 [Volvox africanus]|uniref:Phosphodiesterase n=1 Tax=Volvox africanus TaxID=51714 RepID=A0ABQ5S0R1_9CHLO|nr:hypothetical protein VaNZ11_006457 [Volvox africanus]
MSQVSNFILLKLEFTKSMDFVPRSRSSSSGSGSSPCNSWLRKTCAELRAIKKIVLLYPKSTLVWPLLLLAVILVLGVWGVTYAAKTEENGARDRASILAVDAGVWVQQMLYNAIAPVKLTAAMVSYHPSYPAVKSLFNGLAPVMLAQAPPGSVRVIQLVPHGFVSDLYPLVENEGAMGLDLFISSTNKDGAVRTVADHTLTLVGPMDFVQGGRGFVVRQPIFVSNVSEPQNFDIPHPISDACGAPCVYDATTRTQFWGFASALVNQDVLTHDNRSKLQTLSELGYFYELVVQGADGKHADVVASGIRPRDPVEVPIQLPNTQWVLRVAPDHGWKTKWYGGLLTIVVVLAVTTSVLLFVALVAWRRHQTLLEALLPKRLLRDLRHEDTDALYTCPKIRQAETPADLLLNMMGDLLEGYPPKLPDVVFIRTALLRNLDLYTPLDVRSQIRAADLDSEVAQALMQQLVGGIETGSGGSAAGDDPKAPTRGSVTARSYDVETLSGALAFVLSPEAALRDLPLASKRRASSANPVIAVSAAAAASLGNMHSCPLFRPGASMLVSNVGAASLADITMAPTLGSCDDDSAEDDDAAAAAAATVTGDGEVATSGSIPTLRAPPASQPDLYVSCAAVSTPCNALLRSSAEHGDQVRKPLQTTAAAALQLPLQSCPGHQPGLQHCPLNLNRLGTSKAAAGVGGGVGASALPPPMEAAAVATTAESAIAAVNQPSWSCGSGSISGGSANKLLALTQRLRGRGRAAAAAKCPSLPGSISASISGAIPVGGGGGGGGGAGGGGLRPCSRLALGHLLHDGRRPSSITGAPPPLLAVHLAASPRAQRPPGSPRIPVFWGAGRSMHGGAATMAPDGSAVAATMAPSAPPYTFVRHSRTVEELGLSIEPTSEVNVVMGTEGEEETPVGTSCTRPPTPILEEVERVLATTDSWHFNAWALKEASGGHALSALGFYLIRREGLMPAFQIKPVVLARLLRRVEAGYQDNPYHNSTHAADVLQSLHVLLHEAQLHVHYLDRLGLLAAYFAAIIHDYGHPGLTGDFLIASSHELALRYNDRSPLENHHCAAAFALMRRPDLDVTAHMRQTERASFRKLVIDLVLATDMKQHFPILSHFNTVHRLAAYSHQQHQQHQQQGSHSQTQQAAGGGGGGGGGGGVGTAGGGGGGGGGEGTAGGGSGGNLSAGQSGTRRRASSSGGPAGSAVTNGITNGNGSGNGSPQTPVTLESVDVGLLTAKPGEIAASSTAEQAIATAAPRPVDETERLLSLQLAVKCADVGNLGRELECYKRWVHVLEEEFFLQGDKERDLGLPISPLCDRTKQGVSKSQTGFFDFVALPLVHAMAAAFPGASPLFRDFLANYNYWKRAEAAASRDSVNSTRHRPPSPAPSPPQQQQPSTTSGTTASGKVPLSMQVSPQPSERQSPAPVVTLSSPSLS